MRQRPNPRYLSLTNVRHWSWREWSALLVVAAFLLFLAKLGAPSATEKQQLRVQFHLPDGVELTEIHVGRSNSKPFAADIQGIVQFTDVQFENYLATLRDPNVWQPAPLVHGGTTFHGSYNENTLVWRDVRTAQQIAWGSLSEQKSRNVSQGWLLCFALRETGNDSSNGATTFRGQPCPPPGTPTARAVYVQGLLDADTKLLHMLIRQTRR